LINDDISDVEFISDGEGRNYGIEFTLEKYFTRGYYFFVTSSWFSAKYKPLDGNWYNVRYNNRFINNLVGGKEFRIGEENVLELNGRFICSGGRRYTPVDEDKLGGDSHYVYDFKKAYAEQFPVYLRLDLGVSYRINKPRVSHELKIDIQNLTARNNKGGLYLTTSGEVRTWYLVGILPSVNYRIHF
jgi:outer membrane receptor protein involved in Fe transport